MTVIMREVSILSKTPIEAREDYGFSVDDPTDYHTRPVALVETVVEGKELVKRECASSLDKVIPRGMGKISSLKSWINLY